MSGRGPIGRDGPTGAEGRAGTTGREGIEGRRGEAGATGATGPMGRGRSSIAGFLILMTFAFFGFVAVDRQADKATEADRTSCERTNVLRENQARVLIDQVRQTDRSLGSSLGAFERFRKEIEEGQKLRRHALRRLRMSVKDFPVADRPYAINCSRAHP